LRAGDIEDVFQGLESPKKRPISDSVVAQMGATFPYRLTLKGYLSCVLLT
jgi:hypothetical protein